jgi:hypothetical protein
MARSLEHFPFDSFTPFCGFRSPQGLMLIFFGTGRLIRSTVVGAGA